MKELQMFEVYMVAELNRSSHTVYNYLSDLHQFFDFTKKTVKKVTPMDISSFVVHERNNGCSVSTTNRKLSAIKSFYNYMVEQGIVRHNPAQNVKMGKQDQRLPKPVSDVDIDTLSNLADNIRDKLIFEILYGCGVRRAELVTIRVSDIDFRAMKIRVFGKGHKERVIPINDNITYLVRELIIHQEGDWLFPSSKVEGNHLSTRQLNEVVSKWVQRAGLRGKGITPHKFRHSFCSHLYREGAELKAIKDMAGHSNMSTTEGYVKLDDRRIDKEYQFHPRAKRKVGTIRALSR